MRFPFTPYFQRRYQATDAEFPNTAVLRDRAVTLPLFPGMTDEQQERVVQALADAVGSRMIVPEWHHLPENPYNPHAWIVGEPAIGPGCWIGAFTVIDGSGGLTIGAGCDISAGAQIYTHSTVRRVLSEHCRRNRSSGDHHR